MHRESIEKLEQRARLAVEVYDAVFRETETFDEVGAELAYLLGAILKNESAEYQPDSPLYVCLSAAFPGLGEGYEHPVWNHFAPYDDSLPD